MTANTIDHSKLARNWLIGAGITALVFIAFLVWSDEYLTHSDAETRKNNVLKELREAQTSLPQNVTDERQLR